ncbi:hypothetical protein [Bradyrhizobium sp. 613_E4_N2_2]|uniref:hypothetical protein n=1 Tax=Bradyrhizobium sp. 613_E4_N2_2 TaxID=3240371 RepID=UPI003F8AA927
MKEHGIQNTIRNALVGVAHCFRANVGKGWVGVGAPFKADRHMTVALAPGDVVLRQARPFDTGLPKGFHDLFGFVSVTITPSMVGKKFARFVSWEVKTETGRPTPEQTNFRIAVNGAGGVSDICRTPGDAIRLVEQARQ